VPRRTAIGAAAALAATVITGCTVQHGSRSTPSASASRSGGSAREPTDPDVALAAAVLRSERAMLERVLATARRHPRLAASVSGARAAHQAHVTLLTRAVPEESRSTAAAPTVEPSQVSGRPRSALAALARAETRHSATGRRHAAVARSGPFARVLASMAAASAQQAVHLTRSSAPAVR
jgi:hypothetical protein